MFCSLLVQIKATVTHELQKSGAGDCHDISALASAGPNTALPWASRHASSDAAFWTQGCKAPSATVASQPALRVSLPVSPWQHLCVTWPVTAWTAACHGCGGLVEGLLCADGVQTSTASEASAGEAAEGAGSRRMPSPGPSPMLEVMWWRRGWEGCQWDTGSLPAFSRGQEEGSLNFKSPMSGGVVP